MLWFNFSVNKFFIILVLTLFFRYAEAQIVTGTIIDAKSGEGIPYVNVGIISKGIGTVTDDKGTFKIALHNNDADSLKVSMIGYYQQSFRVADFIKTAGSLHIKLVPDNIQLREVKITNRKYKESILGNTTRSQSASAGFNSNSLGHEIGIVIKIKRSPTYLKQFNASLVNNIIDSVRLRLNIYSVKDGIPDKNLLQQNIFITVKKNENRIAIDLKPYHIMVEDKFFISLEWIQHTSGQGLMFSASLFSSPIIARETSQDKWEKIGIAGVGFNVLAEY
jgi:hypothetical protein